jgi:hypothetical protein
VATISTVAHTQTTATVALDLPLLNDMTVEVSRRRAREFLALSSL